MRRSRVFGLTVGAAAGVAVGVGVATALTTRRRDRRSGAIAGRGVAGRNARLAAVGARSGAEFAVHRARRAVASPARREELDAEHQLRSATQVAELLGNMKAR